VSIRRRGFWSRRTRRERTTVVRVKRERKRERRVRMERREMMGVSAAAGKWRAQRTRKRWRRW